MMHENRIGVVRAAASRMSRRIIVRLNYEQEGSLKNAFLL